MHSMTGFGTASQSWPEVAIGVEIRSVNSRYLDLRFRLPKEAQILEAVIRDRVQAQLSRGRVEVSLTLELRSENQLALNEALVRSYWQAAEQVAALGVPGELTVESLLQFPGVLQQVELDLSEGKLQDCVVQVVDQALSQVVEARHQEGEALRQDLLGRLQRMSELVRQISSQAEDLTLLYRERLLKRVASLQSEGNFDEGRLAQEVCFYAERADITEELTRLETHIRRLISLLEAEPEGQLGRNLDFLCQEMNREMNTIASKASKASISEAAVEGKVEIEKIREQVQNVE